MRKTENLLPCPFCGGKANIVVSDDEGNDRNEEYEKDPWSGLTFKLNHDEETNKDCPIANFEEDHIGVYLYETRDEAIKSWNTRYCY
ncbi:Lar family restriction alleviation protein [Virgibacillus halodenitrificans]|uniref:Lar family restriction alleviation protein n=1 Tax=Virgibacillus halodenitrificans TaxID=1482 RepID=UPI000EF4F8BA|nr:Lar family restriction alleviation protein [Virgibacillus halodenitrificans]